MKGKTMKTFLYATNNNAKIETMRRRLAPLGISLIGLKDMKQRGFAIPEVEEVGKSPLENARIKASAYFQTFAMPVFSCDTGLYFDNLPEELQPGVHVRHIDGKCLTDEEMVVYYSELAKRFGTLTGRYRNAICFYQDEEHIYESMDETLSGKPFWLVSKPRDAVRRAGFPLDSLSVEIESGKYYYDMCVTKLDEVAMDDGFCAFFRKIISPLSE